MNYEEMLLNTKNKIKEKFGTLRHFGYSVDIPYAEINKFFAQRMRPNLAEEFMRNINYLCNTMPSKPRPDGIPAEEREYIRAKIVVNYKNVERFLVDNPEFNKSFISNVINGKRVRNDKRYQRLKLTVDLLKYALEDLDGKEC